MRRGIRTPTLSGGYMQQSCVRRDARGLSYDGMHEGFQDKGDQTAALVAWARMPIADRPDMDCVLPNRELLLRTAAIVRCHESRMQRSERRDNPVRAYCSGLSAVDHRRDHAGRVRRSRAAWNSVGRSMADDDRHVRGHLAECIHHVADRPHAAGRLIITRWDIAHGEQALFSRIGITNPYDDDEPPPRWICRDRSP